MGVPRGYQHHKPRNTSEQDREHLGMKPCLGGHREVKEESSDRRVKAKLDPNPDADSVCAVVSNSGRPTAGGMLAKSPQGCAPPDFLSAEKRSLRCFQRLWRALFHVFFFGACGGSISFLIGACGGLFF